MRGTRHFTEPVSLIRRVVTQSIDPVTGAPAQETGEVVVWTGVGALQPNVGRDRETLTATAGGVEKVLVANKAFLPWDAHPRFGWFLRDSLGREYEMLTEPLNVAGARGYWLLNLGPPTRAPEWVYISGGQWVAS